MTTIALGDSVTLNGVLYRTEAVHEAALREAVALLTDGAAKPAAGPSDSALQVLARLDDLQRALDLQMTALEQRLKMRLELRLCEVQTDIREMLDSLSQRLAAIEAQQQLLVELLDTATAPAPAPARVVPQLARPAQTPYRPEEERHAPAPEVPADPTPFLGDRLQQDQRVLTAFLTDAHLTLTHLAPTLGITPQGLAYRLYRQAKRQGPVAEAALRERLRWNRQRKPSRSAPAGAAPPPSTATGSSRCGA